MESLGQRISVWGEEESTFSVKTQDLQSHSDPRDPKRISSFPRLSGGYLI